MTLKKRGARLALVALLLCAKSLLAQQMPGTGSELKFDSSGNNQQPSAGTLPIQSPTIVTPTPTPATDKINSQTPATPSERQERLVRPERQERPERPDAQPTVKATPLE